MKRNSTAYSMSLLMLLGAACEEVELPEGAGSGEPPVVRAAKAPPIMGGTLLVTRDGAHAVISDPPRDSIHIVDLDQWKEIGTLELDDGALPFRAVEDDDGRVHVTLRGTGELVTIDPGSASLTKTTTVCPNPRGVAFDNATGALHVACAGGVLVTLPASGAASKRFISPDLRDVFVADGRLFVTRFRAAELLEVTEDEGARLVGAPASLVRGSTSREPTTSWRTIPNPNGGWIMLHQAAATDPVPEFEEPPEVEDEGPGDTAGGGYAGGGGFDPCAAVVNPTLTVASADGTLKNAGVFGDVALAVDVALSPNGWRVAIATPTQHDRDDLFDPISVFEVDLASLATDTDARCELPDPLFIEADVVAVAYQPNGELLAQARNRPVLFRVREHVVEELVLTGADASDTGFDLFHNDAGAGIACASCHPEGGEDGRTWVFHDLGPRRTQPLNVGLEGTAPFHWKGDMDDIHMIARKVRQGAMGGSQQSEEHQDALRDWLFGLRPPNPTRAQTDTSAARGQQLFGELGCASCHAGPSFTSPASADLGRGPLQTPALRGVALRPPYMHDGRALTLEEAIQDMARTTGDRVELDAERVASIAAYLESI